MNLTQIKELVEQATGIKDISIKSRERSNVIARCIFCQLAYKNTTSTYTAIGNEIKRNHATVLHSLDNLPVHLLHEEKFNEIYKDLSEQLRAKRLETFNQYQDKETILKLVREIPERKYKTVIELLKAV